jgi:aspartate ammonia-lyase
MRVRQEVDLLGALELPEDCLWGIHTERARRNFPLPGPRVAHSLIMAYAQVKAACCRTNSELRFLDSRQALAITNASLAIAGGGHAEAFPLSALQGGAGTSINMNLNEVIANLALRELGHPFGVYDHCDPLLHVNLHQSTNDTFPTALKISLLRALEKLEHSVIELLEELQALETSGQGVVVLARTEGMPAVPFVLGRRFGAWAEAVARDRWRLYKARERLRTVNLGGTAVGTGLGAPRSYIFRVIEILGEISGLPLARAENLVDATQNADLYTEAMSALATLAANLMKFARDLKIMNAPPSELQLPAVQAGSSIIPGKINPVIPELVEEASLWVLAHNHMVLQCAALGELELNAHLPLIAHAMLGACDYLEHALRALRLRCLAALVLPEQAAQPLDRFAPVLATLLVPSCGYHLANKVGQLMVKEKIDWITAAERLTPLHRQELEDLLQPTALNQLGSVKTLAPQGDRQ